MSGPELSVVIPAYNAQATLAEQLAALAGQEVSFPFEVLLCDNGSTDATTEVVRQWQDRLPGLRLVDASARRGPAAARNIGVRHAAAPLIAFCDADDVVGEGWLGGMHSALQEHQFIAGRIDGDRLNAGNQASWDWTTNSYFHHDLLPQLPAAGSGNMGIRKAVFEEVGGFEEALATNEDTDLSWRVQLAGYPLVYRPEILLHVRKRDGLRAVFRQACAYGKGDRLLEKRYAKVRRTVARTPAGAVPAPADPAPAGPAGVAAPVRLLRAPRRVVGKLLRIRRRRDLVDRTRRVGHWLGTRLTPDTGVRQVEPPPGWSPPEPT